jgi:hypothetical protein
MHFPRHVIVAFLAASSIALGVGTATARDHHDFCEFQGKAIDPARAQERLKAQQERLRQALKLTPAQEPAWRDFVQKIGARREEIKRIAPVNLRNMTAPERLEKILELSRQRQEFLTGRLDAVKTFYATLTAEQKQVFDSYHGGKSWQGKHKRDHRKDPGARREKRN